MHLRTTTLLALRCFLAVAIVCGCSLAGPLPALGQPPEDRSAERRATSEQPQQEGAQSNQVQPDPATNESRDDESPGTAFGGADAEPSNSGSNESPKKPLSIRYHEKRVELAEHEYEMAIAENERIPGVNAKLTLLRLRQQLRYARQLLDHARSGSKNDLAAAMVKLAENDAAIAREKLEWARDARWTFSDAIPERDVKQLELSAELAALALEHAKQIQNTADPMELMQWHMDRMRSELLRLQVKVAREQATGP